LWEVAAKAQIKKMTKLFQKDLRKADDAAKKEARLLLLLNVLFIFVFIIKIDYLLNNNET